MTVVKFKGIKPVSLQFTHTKDGPIIETTLPENLFLKKFLTFALEDVLYQLRLSEQSGLSKKKIDENKFASGFILEYLKILIEEVEQAIIVSTETQKKS